MSNIAKQTAGAILNRYTRPSIGYGVTVYTFTNSDQLAAAVEEVNEKLRGYIGLIGWNVCREIQTPAGKINYIQLFN